MILTALAGTVTAMIVIAGRTLRASGWPRGRGQPDGRELAAGP